MTDPTPTRAEVEALARRLEAADKCIVELMQSIQALRERAVSLQSYADEVCAIANRALARETAARRAESAAWNDAIEAAEAAYAHGFAAIRALRRAAPTEGEA